MEIPRLVWWPILNGIILRTRPAKPAAKYASVWTPEGSLLKVHTDKQTKLLAGYLAPCRAAHVSSTPRCAMANLSIRSRLMRCGPPVAPASVAAKPAGLQPAPRPR